MDTNSGGPATLVWPFSPAVGGYTLATRPSDGMLFFLDSIAANPGLWRWDPSTPTVAPVFIGTPGATTTNVVRLGFDAANNLVQISDPKKLVVLHGLSDFIVVDTGGFEPESTDGIFKEMAKQTRQAVAEADAVIFVVDVRAGLSAGVVAVDALEAQALHVLRQGGWLPDYLTVRRQHDLLPPSAGCVSVAKSLLWNAEYAIASPPW